MSYPFPLQSPMSPPRGQRSSHAQLPTLAQRSPEPLEGLPPQDVSKPRVLVKASDWVIGQFASAKKPRANSMSSPSNGFGHREIRAGGVGIAPMTPAAGRALSNAAGPLAPPVGSAVKQEAKSGSFVVPAVPSTPAPSTPQSGVRPRSNTWDAGEKPVHEKLKQMFEISARLLPTPVAKPVGQFPQLSDHKASPSRRVQSPAIGVSQNKHVAQVPSTPDSALPPLPKLSGAPVEQPVKRPIQRPLLLSERHRKAAPSPQPNSRSEIVGKRAGDVTPDEPGLASKRARRLSFDSPLADRPYIG